MEISQKGISLIKEFEGCKLVAYKCPAGVWTIGIGSTKGVKRGMTITMAQAEQRLKDDIKPIEQFLNRMGINYTQKQFDALVSFIFNLGIGAFDNSTLRKKIIAHANDEEICDQIVRWYNAGGKPLLGLKKRRVAEANMFYGEDKYYINSAGNIRKK